MVQSPLHPEPVTEPLAPTELPEAKKRGLMAKCGSMIDWVFGCVALLGALAACSVVPLLNFVSLGYLLNVSGSVARSGKFREGFIGVRQASIIGSIVIGSWLVLWPVRIVANLWRDAELIAPGSPSAQRWHAALVLLTVLSFWQILWACVRGGKLRHFLWPAPLKILPWIRSRGKFQKVQGQIGAFVLALRLPFFFWLGMRGFIGAVAWLLVPVGFFILAMRLPTGGAALVSLLGVIVMLPVVMFLPFLQARFAATGEFRALFDWRAVRALFRRAPVAFWLALLVTLLLAIPLYLLKIELTPRELAWLPSLLFVLFIFPARVLAGWAIARAERREQPRHVVTRWLGRLAILPVALAYVLIVYATPYLSWNGARALLEQHAFLVPAPLMAL